ncbi:MAG: ABC transporter permease [Candidatus Rokuibacteriota bacterium]|nr:MAG: ABC transporter permease [Candidatus Rokubacteria bacterium]
MPRLRCIGRRRAADLRGPRRAEAALPPHRRDVPRHDRRRPASCAVRSLRHRALDGRRDPGASGALTGRSPVVTAVVTYLVAVALAAAVSALFILAMRGDVVLAFRTILSSSLGSVAGIAQTLNKISPLLLGSMAVMLARQGGFFNIGVDGQMYAGAIVTTGVAFAVGGALPLVVMLPLALLAGFAGGAAFGAVPGALRARWGVNEIFVTVMLNFVAYYFTEWVATGPWNDPITGEAITRVLPESATLPMLLPAAGAHTGILIAIAVSAAAAVLLGRTLLGYEIRTAGDNPRAATLGGVRLGRITLVTLALSGALAGLAGAIEVVGYHNRLILGLTPGYGAMAILIAVLGRMHPLGVGVASVLVAILMVGADSLQRSVKLPASAGAVFQAIVVLCVLLVEARSARRARA